MSQYDFARRLWRVELVNGGRPCLRDTAVSVEVVAERFAAGESIEAMATDYGVPKTAILDAIRLVVAASWGARKLPSRARRRMKELIPVEPQR